MPESLRFHPNDGGRIEAGFRGQTSDCVVRAIAIAAALPYRQVYDELNGLSKKERLTRRGRRSSARRGVFRKTYHDYIVGLGFRWVPCMAVGSGCKVHLRGGELPRGRLIVRLSGHLAAVLDGVIHDTDDPGRGGTRCVYGYYLQEGTADA